MESNPPPSRRRGASRAIPARERETNCLVAAGLLLALAACGGPAPEAPPAAARPSVLVVTVDTLRPDALGWVAGGNPTPAIDRLAGAGVAFPAAVAPAPLTLPAHISMFSGLLPRRHGVRDNHQVLGGEPPLLAERLRQAGYATAAVISGYPLTAGFGLDRGFDRYVDELTAGDGAWLERPADQTAGAARAWLAEPPRRPWLLWVHFYDPHYPHQPPAELAGSGARDRYDGEVAFVDRELAPLLDAATRAAGDELLTVFAADHGESLGEHGETTHGFFVYDATMLVPLVFHWPARLAPARRDEPARLVDLAPTVLDLLGLPPLPETDGVSLAPLLGGGAMTPPPAYLETVQPWTSYGWAPLAAVRHDGWKLIAAPRPELYDLIADPGETTDLWAEERDRGRRLASLLREVESRPAASAPAAGDAATLESLRALGYLGSGGAGEMPPRDELPDPKDRIELRELLTVADDTLRRGDAAGAARLFRQALDDDPGNRFARVRLGLALRQAGRIEEALPVLAEAVTGDPENPETRRAYAEALLAARRPEAAVEQWMEVVRLQPRHPLGWSNLGASLGLSGRAADAVAAYRKAVDLEPANGDRWLRLGFAAFAAGDPAAAAAHLERAAELIGAERFAHAGALGLLLVESGGAERAAEWLARSRPSEADYPAARLALARHELAAGRPAEARRLLREAIAARPETRAAARREPELAPLIP